MKEDRRITRTKDNIKNSLCKILETKKHDDVSVSEVASNAMISRKTFYAHYNTINEILTEIENKTFDKLYNYILNYKVEFQYIDEFVENFFKIIVDDELVISLLQKTTFATEMLTIINKSIISGFSKKYQEKLAKSIPFKLTLEYNIYGCSRLFYGYLKNNRNLDFSSFMKIVTAAIKASLAPFATKTI